MELAGKLGIPLAEQEFDVYDALNSDEAFFTATSYAIMPCTRLNGSPIGDGVPGPVTRRLIAAWSEMVGVDIVAQADEYAERVLQMEQPLAAGVR